MPAVPAPPVVVGDAISALGDLAAIVARLDSHDEVVRALVRAGLAGPLSVGLKRATEALAATRCCSGRWLIGCDCSRDCLTGNVITPDENGGTLLLNGGE